MEFVEPKPGDRIFHSGRITTIDSMDEDNGTFLSNGQWVCISDYAKDRDGIWTKESAPRIFQIGEKYTNRHTSLKGAMVIRPAVYQGSQEERVITSAPCCVLASRRFNIADVASDLAIRMGGWSTTCTGCGWHYRVTLVHTGNDFRLGLYGVRWESMGF